MPLPLMSGPLFSAHHIGSLGGWLPLKWIGPPLEGLADHSAGMQLLQDHAPVTSSSLHWPHLMCLSVERPGSGSQLATAGHTQHHFQVILISEAVT